jgi:phosphonatase-like hydrolase
VTPAFADVRLVVLDVVGTTIRAAEQIPEAFREAFERYDAPVSEADLAELRGRSKREAIARLLATTPPSMLPAVSDLADRIHETFHEALVRRYRAGDVDPIPGAAETIAWLRERGVRTALTTGLDRPVLRVLLDQVGWAEQEVDAVVCADDVPRGRPAPYIVFRAMEATEVLDVHRVALVGDTAADLDAAHNAGVTLAVGVLSGAHSAAVLARRPHAALLPSVADLPSLWAGSEIGTATPHRVEFDALPWQTPMEGVRFKAMREGATQLRLVEYDRAMPPHWCERPHRGQILAGRFEIEFPHETVVYEAGDGVIIPAGPEHRHRARVLDGPVRAIFVEPVPDP